MSCMEIDNVNRIDALLDVPEVAREITAFFSVDNLRVLPCVCKAWMKALKGDLTSRYGINWFKLTTDIKTCEKLVQPATERMLYRYLLETLPRPEDRCGYEATFLYHLRGALASQKYQKTHLYCPPGYGMLYYSMGNLGIIKRYVPGEESYASEEASALNLLLESKPCIGVMKRIISMQSSKAYANLMSRWNLKKFGKKSEIPLGSLTACDPLHIKGSAVFMCLHLVHDDDLNDFLVVLRDLRLQMHAADRNVRMGVDGTRDSFIDGLMASPRLTEEQVADILEGTLESAAKGPDKKFSHALFRYAKSQKLILDAIPLPGGDEDDNVMLLHGLASNLPDESLLKIIKYSTWPLSHNVPIFAIALERSHVLIDLMIKNCENLEQFIRTLACFHTLPPGVIPLLASYGQLTIRLIQRIAEEFTSGFLSMDPGSLVAMVKAIPAESLPELRVLFQDPHTHIAWLLLGVLFERRVELGDRLAELMSEDGFRDYDLRPFLLSLPLSDLREIAAAITSRKNHVRILAEELLETKTV